MFRCIFLLPLVCSLHAISCSGGPYRMNERLQESKSYVQFLPEYSYNMLSMTKKVSTKELYLLEMRKKGVDGVSYINNNSAVIGGVLRSELLGAHSNTSGKFGYLARSPTDFTGNWASDTRIRRGMLSWTGALTDSVTTFMQILFTDTVAFATHKQGSLQMRRAYALFGNLDKSGVYGFIGKKDVAFGDMSTLSPFTPSAVWHYFGGLAEGLGAGYKADNFNIVLTGLCGGRGMRVVDSHQKGKINNGAINLSFNAGLSKVDVELGAGALLGTIYNQDVAEHTDEDLFGPMNPAVDGFINLTMGNFKASGEYAQTLKKWEVVDHKVIAFKAEVAMTIESDARDYNLSLSYSEGIQGDTSSGGACCPVTGCCSTGADPFAFNKQVVLGFESLLTNKSCSFGVEYILSKGFAPLIDVATNSDKDAVQNTIVLFAILAF
jgi:hypothetical protein